MKHLSAICIYFLLLLVTQTSCKKQLNVLPTTQQVDGNVIVDLKSAKTALNGVYYQFANVGRDMNNAPALAWSYAFETLPSQLSGMLDPSMYDSPVLSEHSYTASTVNITEPWSYGYKLVNAANGFIKNIGPLNSIKPTDKRQMIAEARFLRAWANAELLFYYGEYDNTSSKYGIVLHKEMISTSNVNMPRSAVKDCYDFILEDLDSAIAGLPDLNSDIAYTNIWAAKLLKSRVLMERGGSADYTTIISLCQDIISNGPFVLQDNTKDIFLSAGLNSKEVMLGVRPFPDETLKFYTYLWLGVTASANFQECFLQDPRKEWISKTIDVYGDLGEALTKYYPGPAPEFEFTSITENSYALRLTEAYLLQAEALASSGGSLATAKTLLKTVLARAGFTSFSEIDAINNAAVLKAEIIKETMKNFVGEAGQDWLAVRRLPFADLQQLLPSVTDKHQLIFPIPIDEMRRNGALQGMQNPGYGN